jgi:hypothetical protein
MPFDRLIQREQDEGGSDLEDPTQGARTRLATETTPGPRPLLECRRAASVAQSHQPRAPVADDRRFPVRPGAVAARRRPGQRRRVDACAHHDRQRRERHEHATWTQPSQKHSFVEKR